MNSTVNKSPSYIDQIAETLDYQVAMPIIHLLNREADQFPQPTEINPGEWETGYWFISETQSMELVGHPIHLHRKMTSPAFLSGIITGFCRTSYINQKSRKTTMRTVFTFNKVSAKDTTTSVTGWSWAGFKIVP